jgi:hypothetical protein
MLGRVTWNRILDELGQLVCLCSTLGLDKRVRDSRLEEYRATVAKLVDALHSGGADRARAVFNADRRQSFAALTEGAELVEILPFARSVPSKTITPKLRDILKGPALPMEEDSNTNQARNILFELNLATKLSRAGLAPDLGASSDLRCVVKGRTILFECKRPFATRGVRQTYYDAIKQIRAGLENAAQRACGVIAISLTRLLNDGALLFEHRSPGPLEDRLADLLEQTVDSVTQGWSEPGAEVIGILWHVSTPAVEARSTSVLLGVAEQVNAQGKSVPGSEDDLLFRTVVRRLQQLVEPDETKRVLG